MSTATIKKFFKNLFRSFYSLFVPWLVHLWFVCASLVCLCIIGLVVQCASYAIDCWPFKRRELVSAVVNISTEQINNSASFFPPRMNFSILTSFHLLFSFPHSFLFLSPASPFVPQYWPILYLQWHWQAKSEDHWFSRAVQKSFQTQVSAGSAGEEAEAEKLG